MQKTCAIVMPRIAGLAHRLREKRPMGKGGIGRDEGGWGRPFRPAVTGGRTTAAWVCLNKHEMGLPLGYEARIQEVAIRRGTKGKAGRVIIGP
eukprot:scaffold14634_cov112-Isochrysis_galbana.AAC.6